ncbi:MAG: spore germination protein [Candidatus Pristimantibacillus lignocellulolyticus]|uniref:Spore germination protein n=1 Tax=Candidatus Pristimantibacillus lignocellulolyticus TaxID=2994561 RepID=A0A9J6ZL95_9BACL|nr:MAG: spore germination protein [Candidatus Pristimantibacillus lignocellulolyticus]
MQRHAPIDVRQFQILVILFTVGTTVLIAPAGLAELLGQDAWLAPIIAIGPGLLLVLLYNTISSIYPEKTFIELCESLLGVWLGRTISIMFVIFSFLAAAMSLFDVGRFINTIIMPETPILFVNLLFVILLVYAIGSGFDTLARMMELFFPWFMLLFLLMVIFVVPQIDLKNVQPMMEFEAKNLVLAVLSVLSISFMPLVVFLMFHKKGLQFPAIKQRAFLKAVLIGSIISVIIVALTILVIGANVVSLQEFPVYHLARKISIGNFLQRVEVVGAGIWMITIFAKISVYFYASVSGLINIAKLKNQRSILLPLSFLLLVVSTDIFPNSIFENDFNSSDWIVLVFVIGVIIPISLLLVAILKRQLIKSDSK